MCGVSVTNSVYSLTGDVFLIWDEFNSGVRVSSIRDCCILLI